MARKASITKPMIDNADRVAYLVTGFIRSTLTDQERDELDDWVTASDENIELFATLTSAGQLEESLRIFEGFNSSAAIQAIKNKIQSNQAPAKKVVQFKRYLPYAAAAVLVMIATVYILIQKNNSIKNPAIAGLQQELQPGSDKAVLTLSDGSTIILDSSAGKKLQVGYPGISYDNGRLIYPPVTKGGQGETVLHTLSTPNGGQYKLSLSDGTMVWLNAASSITFPLVFGPTERKVSVTGEVFFQVSKDKARPFRVSFNTGSTNLPSVVEVLGTSFNINNYSNETQSTVTLVEGRVKVMRYSTIGAGSKINDSLFLTPGQQAQINQSYLNKSVRSDIENIISWKEGWFEFKNETIENIMKQVARWYDVEVRYEGKINDHFTASIERNIPAAYLLQLLEQTGHVHFQVTGKTIIVKP